MMASKVPLNLKQFMLRQRVLKLYREILRSIYKVPDESSKKELLQWARCDFEKHRHHTDEYTIKTLIFNGERSLKELQQTLELSKAGRGTRVIRKK
ncbi:LYR motif-containing protein 2 [Anabrus simplex]|uniref:LYR motif-containing protein 2 n=1 Tax=Anabrus simplex TaxID=316456 RepID=UPI0034DCEB1D